MYKFISKYIMLYLIQTQSPTKYDVYNDLFRHFIIDNNYNKTIIVKLINNLLENEYYCDTYKSYSWYYKPLNIYKINKYYNIELCLLEFSNIFNNDIIYFIKKFLI